MIRNDAEYKAAVRRLNEQGERLKQLNQIAIRQMQVLTSTSLKALSDPKEKYARDMFPGKSASLPRRLRFLKATKRAIDYGEGCAMVPASELLVERLIYA